MNKPHVNLDVLKKIIGRLVKAAPARKTDSSDPLARLIRAFLEYDCDEARAEIAEKKFQANMVDYNELRVTPAIELAALLGVRYPFAESRCSALHRTLQSIFDREHHMNLARLQEGKKPEIRIYLQSLAGITPYVEAAVALDCFDIPAAPIDTKLLLWLISKDALPEGVDLKTAQQLLEKNLKAGEMADFFHGARKEIDDWAPKVWPAVAKVYSPMLAPPPLNAPPEAVTPPPPPPPPVAELPDDGKSKAKPGKAKDDGKVKTAPEPEKPAAKHPAAKPKAVAAKKH